MAIITITRRNLFPIITLLLSLQTFPFAAYGQVYKWTDEYGEVHYGDKQPDPNVVDDIEEIEIKSLTTVSYQNSGIQPEEGKVVMFMTAWCGYCKKAKRHFVRNNIPFVEYNIEFNSAAKSRFQRLGGKGVPLILAGSQQMSGFSAGNFDRMYAMSNLGKPASPVADPGADGSPGDKGNQPKAEDPLEFIVKKVLDFFT